MGFLFHMSMGLLLVALQASQNNESEFLEAWFHSFFFKLPLGYAITVGLSR